MKILLIEDNLLLSKSLMKGFKNKNIIVEHFIRGDDGFDFLMKNHKNIDIIVLDLMLPGKKGEEICSDTRRNNIDIPIIILSSKDQKSDIVKGLDMGADDYLAKPFEFDELIARLHALNRRKNKIIEKNKIKISNSVFMDKNKMVVYKNNKEVKISPKEFVVLEVMLKYKGSVVARSKIFNEINDFSNIQWSNSIDVYIKNLRKSLFYDEKDAIKTVRGVGYCLN